MAFAVIVLIIAVVALLGSYAMLYIGVAKPQLMAQMKNLTPQNYFLIAGASNIVAVLLIAILSARIAFLGCKSKVAASMVF